MNFQSDPGKAQTNLSKHGVSFEEAATVFDDPLSTTLFDDQHSFDEGRFITVCESSRQRLLFVVYTESPPVSESSEPVSPPRPRGTNMKKSPDLDPLAPRPNLDFSKGVRGKYYDRMQQGTNIVLIEPDLLETFPDSASVNQALRSLKNGTAAGQEAAQSQSAHK